MAKRCVLEQKLLMTDVYEKSIGIKMNDGRAFSVAGPMVWNSLPTEFRDLSVGFDVFRRTVKTILFARY